VTSVAGSDAIHRTVKPSAGSIPAPHNPHSLSRSPPHISQAGKWLTDSFLRIAQFAFPSKFTAASVVSPLKFTRLTNGLQKKLENHAYAVAIHFLHYNFARVHKSLRVAPAMEAGISDHFWTLEEIAALAN
jgi:hypothetical protein